MVITVKKKDDIKWPNLELFTTSELQSIKSSRTTIPDQNHEKNNTCKFFKKEKSSSALFDVQKTASEEAGKEVAGFNYPKITEQEINTKQNLIEERAEEDVSENMNSVERNYLQKFVQKRFSEKKLF